MSRDQRIHWLSPDLVWAVISARDLPTPCWRSCGYAGLAGATNAGVNGYPSSPGTHHRARIEAGPDDVWFWFQHNDALGSSFTKVKATDLARHGWDLGGVIENAKASLSYGTSGPPVQRKAMKDWPHDCPRCKGRECAIELACTWDCRNGCFK